MDRRRQDGRGGTRRTAKADPRMTTTLSPEATETLDRSPLGELLGLAIPTVAQMASSTVMQFLDTWMLSRLGVNEPTAAGNGGLLAWSVMGFGAGVLFCV